MYGMVELPMEAPGDLLRIFAAIASRNTAGTLMYDASWKKNVYIKLAEAVSMRCEENLRGRSEYPITNTASSRSHCFCWLTLFAYDKASDTVRRSRFQFVDLAGSERVKDASGSLADLWGGGTATEGLCTNYSLMMLSKAARDTLSSSKRGGDFDLDMKPPTLFSCC